MTGAPDAGLADLLAGLDGLEVPPAPAVTYTPVEYSPVHKVHIKRDDLFEVAGVRGGKVRTCWHLAQGAKGLVTAGSRASPQCNIVASIALKLGVPCRLHVPSGELSQELKLAAKKGAEVVQHRPGYNSVIVARAREDAAARGWTEIPFGMECEEAVTQTRRQVGNIPAEAKRLVMPVGSGMSLAGVLHGLADIGRQMPVIGIQVGANPAKRLDLYAPKWWRAAVRLVPSKTDYHEPAKMTAIGGLRVDPIYEAKCLELLEPGDLFWVVGIRQSATADACPVCGGGYWPGIPNICKDKANCGHTWHPDRADEVDAAEAPPPAPALPKPAMSVQVPLVERTVTAPAAPIPITLGGGGGGGGSSELFIDIPAPAAQEVRAAVAEGVALQVDREVMAEPPPPPAPGAGSLDLFGDAIKPTFKNITCQRFGLPPFSVLSAREGEWQERKRKWLDMGIASDEGRDEQLTYSDSIIDAKGGCPFCAGKGVRVYPGSDTPRKCDKCKGSGQKFGGYGALSTTSIFDPVLCELIYRWFSRPGAIVLDPFAGGSVRGIVAGAMGRGYVGIDLRQEQVQANRAQAAKLLQGPDIVLPEWTAGDSARVLALDSALYPGVWADMVFSCPPYGDLEVYSDLPEDLSNMDAGAFREAYLDIIGKACARLRPNRFAAFVVGNYREDGGALQDFVGVTVDAFEAGGCRYYNEIIYVTPLGTLPVRAANGFVGSRKIGRTHQTLLVFVKGDPKAATAYCGDLEAAGGAV